jgi:anti-anti-sigma factor
MDEPTADTTMFRATTEPHVVVLAVLGELDVAAADAFGGAVQALRPLTQPLAIDLDGVGFVDSSGLRSLLLAHLASIEDTTAALRLRNVPDRVTRLIELAGLDVVFDVTSDVS